jgi:regulator of protease activity HflC (stomatin/prohibitin superfamily)
MSRIHRALISVSDSTGLEELARALHALGIEIVDVRVRRTDLSENVLEQTYRRMESERKALAQDIRSQGEATKTRMNAETDRTTTEKLSQARKEAEKSQKKAIDLNNKAAKEEAKVAKALAKVVATRGPVAAAAIPTPEEFIAEFIDDDLAEANFKLSLPLH